MDDSPLVDYVARSSVRERVLDAVAARPASTATLADRVAASESGVYDAVASLADRDLIAEDDGTWSTTGTGALVADALARRGSLESLLAGDRQYWRDHDPTALPALFRASLGALRDAEVVRATDTDPGRAARAGVERIATAARLDAVAPVHAPRYVDAVESVIEAADRPPRLLVRDAVFEAVDDAVPIDPALEDGFALRRTDVRFALTATDSAVLLSLPTAAGEYDPSTTLIASSECAREWGDALFEWCWRRATPVE